MSVHFPCSNEKPQTNFYVLEKKNISTNHNLNFKWFVFIPHRKNVSWKNAPKLDFEAMKYCWFVNTCCEFKFRGKNLVFGLNDLLIPSIQIHKKDERACFCSSQERSSCVDTRRTIVRHTCIWSGRHLVQFSRNFWKTTVDLNKTNIPRLSTHHGVSLNGRWG